MQRKLTAIALSVLLVLGGIGTIALSREYFARLILGAASRAGAPHPQATQYKTLQIYYPVNGELVSVETQVVVTQEARLTIDQLLRTWLLTLSREGFVSEPITLQAVSIVEAGTIGLISFDRSLFSASWSSKQKLLCVQSLLRTLQSTQVNALHVLCNHEPMVDEHLDLSAPLPIDGYA